MKILNLIKKSLNYNIYDELVENGAERLEHFPQECIFIDRPVKVYIDNLTLRCGVRGGVVIAALEDSIVMADWKRRKPTKIPMELLSDNPDIEDHAKTIHRWWNKHNRPYCMGSLKIGFGTRGNAHVADIRLLK